MGAHIFVPKTRKILSAKVLRYLSSMRGGQSWILDEANEVVVLGPLFFEAPLEKSRYSFESAADVCSENDSE